MSKHSLARAIMEGRTKDMVIAYICPELHATITKNIDNGFIPERIACVKCGQVAVSMMFLVNQKLSPVFEWFRPSEAETQAAMLSMKPDQQKTHLHYLKQGGLVSREIKLQSISKKDDNDGIKDIR